MIVNEAVVHRMFPGEQLVGTPLLMTFRSQEFGDILRQRPQVGLVS